MKKQTKAEKRFRAHLRKTARNAEPGGVSYAVCPCPRGEVFTSEKPFTVAVLRRLLNRAHAV